MQHFLMEGRKGQKGIWEAEKQTTENIYYTVLKIRVRGCQESKVRLEKHSSTKNSSWGNRHKQLQNNFVDCVQFLRIGNQKKIISDGIILVRTVNGVEICYPMVVEVVYLVGSLVVVASKAGNKQTNKKL